MKLTRRSLPDSLRYLAGKLADDPSTNMNAVSLTLLTLAAEQEQDVIGYKVGDVIYDPADVTVVRRLQ